MPTSTTSGRFPDKSKTKQQWFSTTLTSTTKKPCAIKSKTTSKSTESTTQSTTQLESTTRSYHWWDLWPINKPWALLPLPTIKPWILPPIKWPTVKPITVKPWIWPTLSPWSWNWPQWTWPTLKPWNPTLPPIKWPTIKPMTVKPGWWPTLPPWTWPKWTLPSVKPGALPTLPPIKWLTIKPVIIMPWTWPTLSPWSWNWPKWTLPTLTPIKWPTIQPITVSSSSSSTSPVYKQCYNRNMASAYWKDCSKYIYTDSSGSRIQTCEDNLKYNGFSKCCVPPENVFISACGGDPNKPAYNDVSCTDVGRKEEHPRISNHYFECSSSNMIVEKMCPKGQNFDWQKKVCVDANTATCMPLP